VEVRAGKTVDPVTVDLYPLARIEGRVLDEDGSPVEGILVEPTFPPFRKGLPYMRSATSEKAGRFVLTNLWPRDYAIRLWIPEALRKAGYPAVEFYPGVTDAARAASIEVAEGVQMAGFEIRLRRVPLVDFHGRIVDLGKDEAARVVEVALDSEPGPIDGSHARHEVDAHGRFHFEGVPPGRHVLQVYRGTGSDDLPYESTVEVDKEEVSVPVPPWANLVGVVTSNVSTPWAGVFGIGLVTDGAWRRNVVPNEDGKFTLPNVPPGSWELRLESNNLTAAGRKLRVASARFGTASVADRPMTVTEGGNPPIVILLTDEIGRIAGTVEQDEPKETAVIVLAQRMDGGPVVPGNVAQAGPDGSFLIAELLPGEYRVMAWGLTAARQGALGGDCSKRAAMVTVSNGQTATLKLKRCDQ